MVISRSTTSTYVQNEVQNNTPLATLRTHTTNVSYDSPALKRTISHQVVTDPSGANLLQEYDEIFHKFPWGESLIARRDYPDGKATGKPVILRETKWWSDSADVGQPYYATVKLQTETCGTWTGSAVSSPVITSWSAHGTKGDTDSANPGGSISYEVGPWLNGGTVPDQAMTFGALESMASPGAPQATISATTTITNAHGDWRSTKRYQGGNLVEHSEETGPSRFNKITKNWISSSRFMATITNLIANGDDSFQPTSRFELREGTTTTAPANLISETHWQREDLYPLSSAPGNPLMATSSGTGGLLRNWKITWSSTQTFADSSGAPTPAGLFPKICRMTDLATGLPVLERRYLSSNHVDIPHPYDPSGAAGSGDVLLETKIWLYDANARLLAVKSSSASPALTNPNDAAWTVLESYEYSDSSTGSTVVHTDKQGITTSTVTDLFDRTKQFILDASVGGTPIPNQSAITTTRTFAPRGAGMSGTTTTSTVTAGGWTRSSSETTDALDRTVSSTDETGRVLNYLQQYNSNGELTETTRHAAANLDTEITTSYMDGQMLRSGGSSVVAQTYSYSTVPFSTTTTVQQVTPAPASTPLAPALSTIRDGLGRITATVIPSPS